MRKPMRWALALCSLVGVLAGAGWVLVHRGALRPPPTPVGFAGSSTALKRTVIVPTLDTPMPTQRNVIWCASFLMAWRQTQTQVVRGPIQLAGATSVAERLNRAPLSANLVDEKDRYVNAGRIEDGIIDTIRRDMRQKFPDAPADWLPEQRAGAGIDAYAYLALQAKFRRPYPQQSGGDDFQDSAGNNTRVRTFGISGEYKQPLYDLRQQVEVLFYSEGESADAHRYPVNECAVDLCRTSAPYRIILACVPRQATLADTLALVQHRIAAEKHPVPMDSLDALIVPEMRWRIDHHFAELEGHPIINTGGDPLAEARQVIDFTLDRSGVCLTSAANIMSMGVPKRMLFIQPFLLYITRRGSDAPCFAMWVDNAELLNKQEPTQE